MATTQRYTHVSRPACSRPTSAATRGHDGDDEEGGHREGAAPRRTAAKAKTATQAKAGTKARPKAKTGDEDRRPVVTVPPQVDDELGQLWHQWKSAAVAEARERLILHYAPLVKYVAIRVATGLPASVEQADLVSYGMFGLIDALGKFEPGRGNKFETYAIPRIKGAIIDELRAMDWVPRSVRFKAREIEKAHTDLESMLKRQPTEKRDAERSASPCASCTRSSARSRSSRCWRSTRWCRSAPIAASRCRCSTRSPTRTSTRPRASRAQETRGMLAAAINSLSEREKIVVTLYYFEGLTLAEIGEILGVTESRVCQIHTKAVGGLRGQLSEFD